MKKKIVKVASKITTQIRKLIKQRRTSKVLVTQAIETVNGSKSQANKTPIRERRIKPLHCIN